MYSIFSKKKQITSQ